MISANTAIVVLISAAAAVNAAALSPPTVKPRNITTTSVEPVSAPAPVLERRLFVQSNMGRLCLDAPSTANGAIAQVWGCHGGSNQDWTYNPQDYTLRVKQTGKCLDVPNGNGVNGQKIQLWDCTANNPNQKWILLNDGRFLWAGNAWMTLQLCLDVNGRSNGAQLQLWKCHKGANQSWITTKRIL
jgi:hypothetical protein